MSSPYDKAICSFDYGNAHIAVLATELPESDWPSMMQWLQQDMTTFGKTWKIVIIHRPPYHAHPNSGNGLMHKYLPPVVDAAGVDLVVSGHDHMYARSLPLLNGQPDSAGAIYLIAGSHSAKFYDSNDTGIVSFAEVLFDNNLHTFTTLAVRGGSMHILTRTLDGKVVDDAVITPRATR